MLKEVDAGTTVVRTADDPQDLQELLAQHYGTKH
jgi:hypothetical protein